MESNIYKSLIFLVIFGYSTFSSAQEIARDYYNVAVNQTDNGNYDEAIANYSQAIQLNSLFHEAFFGRGYVYYLKGDFKNAVKNYDKAISIQPVKLYYYQRGWANLKNGYGIVAIQDFTKAIKLDPDYADAILQRGRLFDVNNRKQFAIEDYKKVLNLGVEETSLYYEIGFLYGSLNMPDSSLTYYTASLKYDKPSISAYQEIGVIFEGKNEFEKAIETYSLGISDFPDYDYLYFRRGMLKLKYDAAIHEACSDLKKASELGHKLAGNMVKSYCIE